MSLKAVSVKVNNRSPIRIGSVSHNSPSKVSVDSANSTINLKTDSINGVSVKVNDQNPSSIGSVAYDSNITVKVDGKSDYILKTSSNVPKRLRDLLDVSASAPIANNVLIYNANTQKYETGTISVSQVDITNIDAGTF